MNDSTSNLEDGLSNSNDNFGSINDFVQEAISSHDDFLSLFSKFSEIVGNFDLPEDLPPHVFTKVKSIIEPQVMSSLDNSHAYVNGVLPGKRQRVEVRTTQENGSLGGPVGKLYCSSFSFSRSGDPICELAPTAKMPSFADDLTLGELRSKLSGNRIIQKVESVFPHDSNLPLHLGDLECPLCLRVYWNPDVTPCGHTFCSDCLERTLDHDPKCPLCKYSLADFTEAQRFYDKHMQRLIKQEEEEIKAKIPIFVCTLAFPCVPCPLHVFEPRHRLLLRRCIRSRNGEFGMNLPCISPGQLPYERNGTLLKVRNTDYFNDGRVVVDSVGVGRFKVQNNLIIDGYDAATVERVIDVPPRESDMGRLATLSTLVFQRALQWFESLPDDQSQALIRHYGEMPDRSTEQQEYANSDGPAWTWWVLAVIPAEDRIKLHVIGQTSLLNRLKLISRVITCIIQSQSTHPP
ncbi:unnamed protein product [Oikopleura dioica]|uniref:RING-type domain-containing protein n=1 Tax=Oikopleura dioica TaxID=34765 RepID=E4WQS7_OIKDI|nr:unnamed protein product [Oikopleura dioica]